MMAVLAGMGFALWAVTVVYWAAGHYLVVAAPETSFGDIGDGFILGLLPALAVIVFLVRNGWIELPDREASDA